MLLDLVDEVAKELFVLLRVNLHLLVQGIFGGSDELLSLFVTLLGSFLNSAHFGLQLAQLAGFQGLQIEQPLKPQTLHCEK
jgi:hypothetical protein